MGERASARTPSLPLTVVSFELLSGDTGRGQGLLKHRGERGPHSTRTNPISSVLTTTCSTRNVFPTPVSP